MDGLEISKLTGCACAALLLYVGGNSVAKGLYSEYPIKETAIPIELPDTGAVEEVPLTIPELLAMGDASNGERVFKACQSCHTVDKGGKNGIGPNLWGALGAQIGTHDGFSYSSALSGLDMTWDWEAMNGFLANPRGWASGTAMSYRGLRKDQDRADLLLWLNEHTDTPLEVPEFVQLEETAPETPPE